MPHVIVTEDLDAAALAWLRDRCTVTLCPHTDAPRLHAALADAQGLVVRTYTRVNTALLAHAPRLRCVARAGVGLDNIDVAACEARGVRVVHTPDANTQAVAEYVFALVHDAVRPRVFLDHALDEAAWRTARRELAAPRQMSELTLGVLGLGRIGSRVARIAHGYDMDVLYHDIREVPPSERQHARPVTLEELLRRSDVLTVHIDPRPANKRFLNASLLAQLRATAVIINTSRGMVMDELALAGFLRDHPKAQALLDVHDPEPFPPDDPLLNLPNAFLSPHIAAATATAHANMSWVVRDLMRELERNP
jgi:phosphoglycerate dehydrogenase-like enzyme